MFTLMLVIFVLGYTAIALEHPLKVNKAAPALLIGVLTWVFLIIGKEEILQGPGLERFQDYLKHIPKAISDVKISDYFDYIAHHEVLHHLGEISEILFFLLGAMTIVEIVDQHQGFKIITDKITTTNKVKLLWILSVLTFFMSAALDNLTTSIVMVALLRKLVADKKDRWLFASMIIIAANSGGAWSPIGDVTTIMLWIGTQVTTQDIILHVIVPSLVSMVAPLIVFSFFMKGEVKRPERLRASSGHEVEIDVPAKVRNTVFILGVGSLLFVPVFKTLTHLPPFLGMLQGLGILWVVTEIFGRNKNDEASYNLTVVKILTRVDVPTVLFFLGILSAVAALQTAGHLKILAEWLDETFHNIYIINIIIGILSSIVDNVPLVAGAMGMYQIVDPAMIGSMSDPAYAEFFVQNGRFWEFLAYCAGTGGSVLIIGSAAGVAVMGMEKIDFIWYMKKISVYALIGYFSGAATYYLMFM